MKVNQRKSLTNQLNNYEHFAAFALFIICKCVFFLNHFKVSCIIMNNILLHNHNITPKKLIIILHSNFPNCPNVENMEVPMVRILT